MQMPQSNQEIYNSQEHQIDLKALFKSLAAGKFLIAGLTVFVTILAILYVNNLTPSYKATSSFTSPSAISVTAVNKLNLVTETKDSIFSAFLTKLSSKIVQKQAFINGDFINKFNTDNSPIDNIDAFISGAIGSVRVHSPDLTSNERSLSEKPYSVSMEGFSAEPISEYLNTLIALANSKTIEDLVNLNDLNIKIRLEEISVSRELLLKQAERDRLLTIERIIEKDGQKIRQINAQIDRARYEAKENRLNQIESLKNSVKLAKSLEITDNNFNVINDAGDLTIAFFESKNLPDWYLYGEKALLKRVELLENRKNDDPFIEELVTLNSQLYEVQKNTLLQTLKERKNDSPFINISHMDTDGNISIAYPINDLITEKNRLESLTTNMNGVNAMKLSQISTPPNSPINSHQRTIVLLAFFGSFMVSIFLVLIMGALKPDEKLLLPK